MGLCGNNVRNAVKLEQQKRATGLRARVLDNEAFSRIRSAQPPQCDSFGGYVHVFPIWTDFGPIQRSQTARPHILRTGEAARRAFDVRLVRGQRVKHGPRKEPPSAGQGSVHGGRG
jgi:hypothetical protein